MLISCWSFENNRFVLTEECPAEPAANAARSVREPYERWIQANNKVRAYMLVSMSDVLRLKHERMENALRLWIPSKTCSGNNPNSRVLKLL